MRLKTLVLIFAVLCLFASFAMYVIGDKSVQWPELKLVFWIPLPISIVLIILARKMDNKE